MARRSKRSSGIGLLLVLALVVFGAAAALGYYFARGSDGSVRLPKPKPVASRPPVVTLADQPREVTVFLPRKSDKGFYLVPVTRRTELQGSTLDVAAKTLLATSEEEGPAATLIPAGTRLLSPVKVTGRTAVLNLSGEFVDGFSGGSDQEALTLNSIVHTLVYNSEGRVKEVMILVEGETAETLGGHFDLTEPVEADSTLLKPDSGS